MSTSLNMADSPSSPKVPTVLFSLPMAPVYASTSTSGLDRAPIQPAPQRTTSVRSVEKTIPRAPTTPNVPFASNSFHLAELRPPLVFHDFSDSIAHRSNTNISKRSSKLDACQDLSRKWQPNEFSEDPLWFLAPTITTTKKSLKKKTHKRNHSATDDSDPNMGWPIEAHLKFPDGTKMQRTISLRIQPQAIQDILHEAITLASGLSMFEEAFPSSAQQLAQSYTSIVSAATSLKHPLIANRIEKDDIFRKHLTSYVTGRVGKMRVNVKEAAVSVVPGMYGILRVPTENGERKEFVKDLLTKMNFIFPRKTGPKSFSQRFADTFNSTSKTDNAKEVPHAMLSLVVIAVFAAIKEWEGGKDEREKQEFVASTFADQYTLHTALINEKIRNAKVGNGAEKYHTLMARLYREAAKISCWDGLAVLILVCQRVTASKICRYSFETLSSLILTTWGQILTILTKYFGGLSLSDEERF
ncbi:hypothetical protein F5878DRAFT_642997 [Lentinula raphanica]|uniref:DUF6532 domain-containing protein n=1 Tax=Lentinula raphanica TaxID=153919 RepID=A0AA38P6D1_9AGAR|nr:hypothetical protein F5878DRAFT_642997 [Lentinula raphanica]